MAINRYTVIYHDGTETDVTATTKGEALNKAKRHDKRIKRTYKEVTE